MRCCLRGGVQMCERVGSCFVYMVFVCALARLNRVSLFTSMAAEPSIIHVCAAVVVSRGAGAGE